jgi:prepilin-type N-terminal cleavage/methylation domain-containing protein
MRFAICRAFTLIELLVVITIIVVLLALLTPALDRAIYQAQLTVCGAQLGGSSRGFYQYALDYKRWYPPRGALGADQPIILKSGIKAIGSAFDARPPLVGYIDLDAWVDPLVEPIDMDIEDVHPDSWVFSPVVPWYSFRFRAGQEMMARIGDRFSWYEMTDTGEQVIRRFDFLVTDRDAFGSIFASHPDADGKMINLHMQNEDNELEDTYRDTGGAAALSWLVASFWKGERSIGRGVLDLNYLHQDGSVRRLNNVVLEDERMVPVPNAGSDGWGWNGGWSGSGMQLPR